MAQSTIHHIIIVPGLGDKVAKTRFWLKFWQSEKVFLEVWSADWEDSNDSYGQKYERLYRHVKELRSKKIAVSLIGISAGASLVGNVYIRNSNSIHKVVTVCGRLVMEKKDSLPSLQKITFRNKAYIESVKQFEQSIGKSENQKRKRIMTLSGMYDELVPVNTSRLDGAVNRYIPIIGHGLSITIAFLFFKSTILDFIES